MLDGTKDNYHDQILVGTLGMETDKVDLGGDGQLMASTLALPLDNILELTRWLISLSCSKM